MCIPSHMITVDVHLGPNPKGGIEESVKVMITNGGDDVKGSFFCFWFLKFKLKKYIK